MPTFRVPSNTTAVDVALDLSGSVAGLPATLGQMPAQTQAGFPDTQPLMPKAADYEAMPELWEDIENKIDQTWTPELEDQTLTVTLPMYKQSAADKSPFFTDKQLMLPAVNWGNDMIQNNINLITD